MTNKENVKIIYPKASCQSDMFGIQYEINTGNIKQDRFFGPIPQIISTSTVSIKEAWKYAWINIQEQMLKKLES
jgi:hypothetical protein